MATLAKSNATATTKGSKAVGKTTESLTSKGSSTKSSGSPAPVTRPPTGRMMFGLVVFLLGANVINIFLAILDHNNFHDKLTKTVIFTMPILGHINLLLLISLPILVVLFWALNKFKIMPSQAEMRAGAVAQANARNTTGRTAPAPAATGGGFFANMRAAVMGNAPASAATAKASSSAKTSSTSKTTTTNKVSGTGRSATTVGKPTVVKSATSTAGANAKTATKKANVVADDGEEADDIYAQVRAQKLAQSRKRRKR